MKHYLTVFLDNIKQKTILLNSLSAFDNGEIKIGRADDNDIILPFASVSRHHAVIEFSGDTVDIVDAGSLNKIRVSGTAYSRIRLTSGMNVTIGTSNNVITLRYTCEAERVKRSKPVKATPHPASAASSEAKSGVFFGARAAAHIIDLFLLFIIWLGASSISFLAFNEILGLKLTLVITALLIVAALWAYFIVGESGPNGATIGKKATKIRVVDFNTGDQISLLQATKRVFTRILSMIILFIGFLPLFPGRRTLHDYLSGTKVVKLK